MIKTILTTLIVLLIGIAYAQAEPYKVAIIDSGFMPVPFSTAGLKLCKKGHYDYSTNRARIGIDLIGHGAYVTALIDKHADTSNVCYLIYKVFGGSSDYRDVNKALRRAIRYGAKAVNLSLTISVRDYSLKKTLKLANALGVKVFTAAGNKSKDLNNLCNSYPVCFNNVDIEVIGATDKYSKKAYYSNYGLRITAWEIGDLGKALGTSFASPRALGKYIKSLNLDGN